MKEGALSKDDTRGNTMMESIRNPCLYVFLELPLKFAKCTFNIDKHCESVEFKS